MFEGIAVIFFHILLFVLPMSAPSRAVPGLLRSLLRTISKFYYTAF